MFKYLLAALLVFVVQTTASALEVKVLPDKIYPGDAFLVKVTGVDEKPLGVYNGAWLNFASCGEDCFEAINVVDLDDPVGDKDLSINTGEVNTEVVFKVLPKDFPSSHLTLPTDKVILSKADEARADRETVMLKKIWKQATDKLWDGNFIMPCNNSCSTVFGVRRLMNGVKKSVHTGLDIRGRTGEPVKASNKGRVIVAQELFYGGNTIVLDHGQGIYTYYMHLSKFDVAVGDMVEKGAVIGEIGATGRATGPHLHFGVKIDETNANPVSLTELPL